ncbi:MAG: V4R domain-containing protein [Oscillospiraceae bacterium]
MNNVFKKTHNQFSWTDMGDIKEGRGDLGEDMPVLVYRLMQYTMLDVLTRKFGSDEANVYFRQAGDLAGSELTKNTLDVNADFDTFIAALQEKLKEFKIGILRMEDYTEEDGNIVLTVAQDLDCSGLPVTNETVCSYDEGFIAGILKAYFKKNYVVREVDCWANGDRVCRFRCEPA